MAKLPDEIVMGYRVATTSEVHSWSYGAVTGVRRQTAQGWEERRGTLDDESIFGPKRDFGCACGKYRQMKDKDIICDRCGCKVTTKDERRRRFAHVNLEVALAHPMGEFPGMVEAWPVLPAAFFESSAGRELAEAYDALVSANNASSPSELATAAAGLSRILLPPAVEALRWNLQEAETLLCGMCLVRREGSSEAEGRCEACGYPLEGMQVTHCPGCGRRIVGQSRKR